MTLLHRLLLSDPCVACTYRVCRVLRVPRAAAGNCTKRLWSRNRCVMAAVWNVPSYSTSRALRDRSRLPTIDPAVPPNILAPMLATLLLLKSLSE
jgi:hypothetical protein